MANNSRERIFKITLVALIVGLGIILFRQARPFFGGILSALTLYILLRRPTFRLAERLRRPTLATVIMVLAVIIFIAVPLTLIIWFIVSQIQQAEWNVGEIIAPAQQMFDIIEKRFGIDIVSQQTISFVAGKLTALGQSVLGGIGNFFVNLLVAVLLLFFLLNGGRKMEQYLASIIPMKNINKRETMEKVNKMVKSNAIGIPMVATLQGIIAFIGYMIFDVPNAGLAAIATGFCSIVPIVGTMVVWVPLGIYFMVLGQWGQAIGLLVFSAIFISQSDNLLRFILQKKMADTHPLITIFGVFLGLSLFGFIGIIFGPLLVSLFLLFVDMFRKEYLSDDEADGEGGSQSAADSPASAEPAAAAQADAPGKPTDSAQAPDRLVEAFHRVAQHSARHSGAARPEPERQAPGATLSGLPQQPACGLLEQVVQRRGLREENIGNSIAVVQFPVPYELHCADHADTLLPERLSPVRHIVKQAPVLVQQPCTEQFVTAQVYEIPVVDMAQVRQIEADAAFLQDDIAFRTGELLHQCEQRGKAHLMEFRRYTFLEFREIHIPPACGNYLPRDRNLDPEEPVSLTVLSRAGLEEARKSRNLLRVPLGKHRRI